MTEFFQLTILAIVQGITEFLPISSSAHLILLPELIGWVDQGLSIDVALHMGTLAAVCCYFRGETAALVAGGMDVLRMRDGPARRLFILIAVGTVPVVLAGFALKSVIEGQMRSAAIIAVMTILFGIVLFAADRLGTRRRAMDGMTVRDAALIGLAQAIALVPGVSRSGVTMAAGLLLGFSRPEAARFSLLLSIPTTFAAGTLITYYMARDGDWALGWSMLVAAAVAFVAAYLAIWGMMSWLRRSDFTPFVIYRLALGLFLLWWLYA